MSMKTTTRFIIALLAAILLPAGGAVGPASGEAGAVIDSRLPERAGYVDFKDYLAELYTDLDLEGELDYGVFEVAMIGYYNLIHRDLVPRDSIITVIDYTRPSAEERLVVLDLESRQVLHTSLVAHGMNSGEECAESFSNEPGSLQSSLGFYVTGEEYVGAHGKALRLAGVDTMFNDRAEERCIVVHGAWYCTDDFVEEHGRLGRSWGCPVLPPDMVPEMIDDMKDGTCLFAYYDDDDYMRNSTNMDPDRAVEEYTKRRRTGR